VTRKPASPPQQGQLVQLGQSVDCAVERVFPFGVFVRLDNGVAGFIRQSELTLATDIDPRRVLIDGQPLHRGRRLHAVVSRLPANGKVELSLRATLRDPWLDYPDYPPDTVVQATVTRVYPDSVHVALQPGIMGLIPLAELATKRPAHPEQLLWPGDHVKAAITSIDRPGRRVYLSLRRLLGQQTVVQSVMAQLTSAAVEATPVFVPVALPPVLLKAPVLVIDDNRQLREPLVSWLRDQGCGAYGPETSDEILQLCVSCEFGLVLLDLDMPEMDGLTILRWLRENSPQTPVAVMSVPDLLAHHWSTLRAHDVVAAFDKPLDMPAIRALLEQLVAGARPSLSADLDETPLPTELAHLSLQAPNGRHRPIERIRAASEQLMRDVQADLAVVFRLDRAARAVSIMTQTGRETLQANDLYYLLGSPVKDVIVENRMLWENSVTSGDARFRKLLDAIPFQSCVAIPLEAGGQINHALFVFSLQPYHFDTARLRTVMATGILLRAALETLLFEDRVRAETPFIISGNLASTLGHELGGTLSGLDLTIRNAITSISRMTTRGEAIDVESIGAELVAAGQMANQLKDTVREFQRLMKNGQDGLVDVNRVIRDACVQAKPLAVRHHVRLALELADDLPPISGNEVRLLHVFLNLLHNAIEQIAEEAGRTGEIRLSTAWGGEDDGRPIKVRLADTGPGIHHERWDTIFALGFTTRAEGHGLGLYIARDAVEKMDGRIVVEESYMALGTTFLVELPAAE